MFRSPPAAVAVATLVALPSLLNAQATPRLTLGSATAIAQHQFPTGTVKSHELETEKGKLIYSFDISVPGKNGTDEINVDAMSGMVVGHEHESAAAEAKEAAADSFTVVKYSIGGTGGTDYLTAEAGTGRVFVSRSTHVMVIDGATGKVLGDIPDTPGTHGIALSEKSGHGFTTNGGDSTLTMFDLKTLAVIKKIPMHTGGLDGIMYDESTDRVILTNHSRPVGTLMAVDAKTGGLAGTAELSDNGPEGAASDGKGRYYVNLEGKSMIEVVDAKTMKSVATWPLSPCDGPTGIALDRPTMRLFVGCGKTSVVVDAVSGKIVSQITNGDRVDALGYDASRKLIYIPAGSGDGSVTIVHQEGADKYTTVATVHTMVGAKTIAVDPVKHMAYLFQPEYGPAPAADPTAPAGGRRPRGPIIGTWFFAISHY